MFDAARLAVYALGTSDLGLISEIVEQKAAALGSPATPRQRTAIARSTAKFMKTRGRKAPRGRKAHPRPNRGILRLDRASLDLCERQRLGALHTASTRREITEARLNRALHALVAAEVVITQAALAEAAGLKLRQVQHLWNSDIISLDGTHARTRTRHPHH